jgi:hypothetical protein
MTVKANVPTLYKQLKKLPWTAIPAASAVSTAHGRPAADAKAASNCMSGFAVSLAAGLPL